MAEKHKIGVREDLSGRADYVLPEPLYNERQDRKHDQAKYDVYGSNDTKDIAKTLRDIKERKRHRYAFRSALKFPHPYEALALEKKEERAIIRDDSG